MQSEEDTPDQVGSIPTACSTSQQQTPVANPKIVYVWSWKETPSQMFQHAPHSIVGDPSDCWIRYGRFSNAKLEAAYQNREVSWDLDPQYVVDLAAMTQMNKRTGFQRKIQRTVETPKVWCWKETEGLMWKHNPSTIYGNPSDCWIKYSETQNDLLETAYMINGDDEVSPANGLVVDFAEMVQTNEATGLEREVQRVDVIIADEDNTTNIQRQQQQQIALPDIAAVSSSSAAATAVAVAPPKKVWCWQETDGFMGRHDPSTIYGDPSNSNNHNNNNNGSSCWIKYSDEATAILEDAFQTQPYGIVSPCEGYNVNLAIMKQVNIVTGFERDVQRVDAIMRKQKEEQEDASDTLLFTVAQAQQMETRLQSELQNNADATDQKLKAMAAKFEARQTTAMEQDLEKLRSQLKDTQSELKQTTVERDELKQEMASMKESLDGLKKTVEESLNAANNTSPANAVAGDDVAGVLPVEEPPKNKKRPNSDLEEENVPDQKRTRQEEEEK